MPTFIFAVKQYLHLHLLWSHTIICLCNEAVLALFFFHKTALTFYLHWGHIYTSFIPKLCQHSFLSWSHDNTSFASKPCQRSSLHSYWSHEATSTIHFCHEVMPTLHISTKVMSILVFATKPRQQFIRTKAMPTFIFVMKLWQHSILALALALKLHQYLHWATSKLHLHWSHANIHEATKSRQHFILALKSCQYSSLPWSHDNTSFTPKLCQRSSLSWSHNNTPH